MREYFVPGNSVRKQVVQNAWVFRTRKYWAENIVQNAWVLFTSTIIGRNQWYIMREYFLPTIRLTTWTCLIVGWKCWPFCTRTIIGQKQEYKMREYVLPENSERKFGWKSVSILYQFFRTTSSGIKKVAQKAKKKCFPLLRSGTKKYIICPNDDQQLWTSQSSLSVFCV